MNESGPGRPRRRDFLEDGRGGRRRAWRSDLQVMRRPAEVEASCRRAKGWPISLLPWASRWAASTAPPARSDASGRSGSRPRFGPWCYRSTRSRSPSARWMSPRSARTWQPGCKPPSAARPASPPPTSECARLTPIACPASASSANGGTSPGVHGPGREAGGRGGLQGQGRSGTCRDLPWANAA